MGSWKFYVRFIRPWPGTRKRSNDRDNRVNLAICLPALSCSSSISTKCCSASAWQHLPDYGAYHAALVADPALPGKWQAGEEVIYLLVFEGELLDGSTPETQARRVLTSRLSETLPIPILDEWNESLWEVAQMENLIVGLLTGGDCQEGYLVQLTETVWKEVITRLLKERKICISGDR